MSLNDNDLVRKVLSGDKDAFEDIIYLYQSMVYRVCLRFMKNREDAEDMSQEVFIQIYRKLGTFNFNSSLSTWIYSICVNVCLNKLKAQGRYKFEQFQNQICISENLSPAEAAEINEEKNHVISEINKLNDKSKAIVKLRLFGEKDFSEIAKLLNIPASSARTSYVRAREYLKKALINFRREGF